ncbi:MAG: VOC family protein [Pseudomonadota bacterium]
MIEYLEIAHVSVLVAKTERALCFYRDVLGLRVLPERPDLGYPGAWLAVGGQQIHLLELPNMDANTGRPAHGGRDRHTAILVRNLALVREALHLAGIAYTSSRSGRDALFCRDPDGNALEFMASP